MRRALAGCMAGLLYAAAAACQVGETSEFETSDHALVQSTVTDKSAQPVHGAWVTVRFPGVSGGISSPRESTDAQGKVALLIEVFGRGGSVPLDLDSLPAYLIAAAESPGGSPEIVQDSIALFVKFGRESLPPPLSSGNVQIPLPGAR